MAARDNRHMPEDERGNVLAFPQAPDAIELRHLRAFVAVAEELNFGRAADRLYVSQSALSRQVRGLEQLLGCDLLRRTSHSGELAGRLAQLWAPMFAVAFDEGDLQAARDAYERFHAQFTCPPEVAITPVNAGGVPAFELAAAAEQPLTILYLHGGGHVMGSAFGHRPLLGALAVAAGARVVAPEYRLAPEHPFPADLEDVTNVYRWLLDTGTPAEQVVVAGDSSGCGVVMALLLSLRHEGGPLPAGAVLFCPWTDLSGKVLRSAAPGDEQIAALLEQ